MEGAGGERVRCVVRLELLRGVVAVPSSVILSAAADCTPLLAHHLEPLLLLQGSTCLIR